VGRLDESERSPGFPSSATAGAADWRHRDLPFSLGKLKPHDVNSRPHYRGQLVFRASGRELVRKLQKAPARNGASAFHISDRAI